MTTVSGGLGISAFILPDSADLNNIPQDPSNPLTPEKVALGQMLFHETALATEGVNDELAGTWSCASCHHGAAGFKSGVPQGIAEGGEGFGLKGENRIFAAGFDKASADPKLIPDVQPAASPAVLNVAFQDVMLWNGQFGNAVDGIVNAGLADEILATQGTPKAENSRQLSGVEVQAIAGTGVHRMKTSGNSIVQTNVEYIAMFDAAFPQGTEDATKDAGKAIAAFERTILATESPFQMWLKSEEDAINSDEITGATLFYGKAGCVNCHTGPGLS
jgi:cytochrome c peroxidase